MAGSFSTTTSEMPPVYFIYRDSAPGEPVDVTAPLQFYPPHGSDELFDALRHAFPHLKTHSERVRDATIAFLLEERETEQLLQTSPTTTSLDASPTWPSLDSSISEFSTPSLFTAETSATSTGSPSIAAETPATLKNSYLSYPDITPPPLSQMTGVFSLNSAPQPKERVRRRMTEAERAEYRRRRLVKACDKCAKRKRKCLHNGNDAVRAAAIAQDQQVKMPRTLRPSPSKQNSPQIDNISSTNASPEMGMDLDLDMDQFFDLNSFADNEHQYEAISYTWSMPDVISSHSNYPQQSSGSSSQSSSSSSSKDSNYNKDAQGYIDTNHGSVRTDSIDFSIQSPRPHDPHISQQQQQQQQQQPDFEYQDGMNSIKNTTTTRSSRGPRDESLSAHDTITQNGFQSYNAMKVTTVLSDSSVATSSGWSAALTTQSAGLNEYSVSDCEGRSDGSAMQSLHPDTSVSQSKSHSSAKKSSAIEKSSKMKASNENMIEMGVITNLKDKHTSFSTLSQSSQSTHGDIDVPRNAAATGRFTSTRTLGDGITTTDDSSLDRMMLQRRIGITSLDRTISQGAKTYGSDKQNVLTSVGMASKPASLLQVIPGSLGKSAGVGALVRSAASAADGHSAGVAGSTLSRQEVSFTNTPTLQARPHAALLTTSTSSTLPSTAPSHLLQTLPYVDRLSDHVRYKDHHGRPTASLLQAEPSAVSAGGLVCAGLPTAGLHKDTTLQAAQLTLLAGLAQFWLDGLRVYATVAAAAGIAASSPTRPTYAGRTAAVATRRHAGGLPHAGLAHLVDRPSLGAMGLPMMVAAC